MVHPSRFILMEYSARLFILQNVPPRRQRRASPLIISLSFIVPSGEWSPAEECAFRFDERPSILRFSYFSPLRNSFTHFREDCYGNAPNTSRRSEEENEEQRMWFSFGNVFCRKFDPLVSLLRYFSSFHSCYRFNENSPRVFKPLTGRSILVLIYIEMRIFICSS